MVVSIPPINDTGTAAQDLVHHRKTKKVENNGRSPDTLEKLVVHHIVTILAITLVLTLVLRGLAQISHTAYR